MTKLKLLTTLLSAIVLTLVFSGCAKKEQPKTNNNTKLNQDLNIATTTAATSTAEIDTSNWKTYKNEEYGFEFKYPEDWNMIFESSKKISFYSQEWFNELDAERKKLLWPKLVLQYYSGFGSDEKLIKKIFNINNSLSMQDTLKDNPDFISYTEILIDNKKVKKLEVGGEISLTYYFLKLNDNNVLIIEQFNDLFDRTILNSIKIK